MADKDEIEKEYEEFERNIKSMAENEIKRIRKRAEAIKSEAEKVGKEVKNSSPDEGAKEKRTKGK